MRVAIGKFAQAGLESRLGRDIGVAVQSGLVQYTRRLASGEPPVGVPSFCHDPGDDGGTEFEVPVDPETEDALKREARRQQVSVAQILAHATLVYLAGLDAASAGPDAATLTSC
jgi:hypothetical protein